MIALALLKNFLLKPLIISAFCALSIAVIGTQINSDNGFREHFSLFHSLAVADYGELIRPIGWTLFHAAFIVALSIGFSLMIVGLCTAFPWVRFVVVPNTDFFRAVPATLICPLLSIAFNRSSDYLLAFICAIPCSSILIFSLLKAYDDIPKVRFQIYRLNRGGTGSISLAVTYYCRALMPDFVSAVKLIVSYALVMACVLEMFGFGNKRSVGNSIAIAMDANGGEMSGTPMVLIFTIGLISYGINAGLSYWEARAQAKCF